MPYGETIAALATPAGESALAVVRLSGPRCAELACACLGRGRPPPPRRAIYGHYHGLDGTVVDEVVATLFAAGASFTGEPVLELSCHGNPLIARRILDDLLRRGCRPAEPGEFTRTAFMNGRLDLSQAEAVADVIRARSERSLEAARRQLAGALGERVSAYTEELLETAASIEAYIDFPEEDLPAEDPAGPIARIGKLDTELRELAETSRYRELLDEGVPAVIVGAPNAGKSTLLNALLGEERAIVSEEPGTTRDFISERIRLGDYCIQITDTAGLHAGGGQIEREGMRRTRERLAAGAFFLVVVDSAAPSPTLPADAEAYLRPERTLVVENKTDLPGSRAHEDFLPRCPHFRISLTQPGARLNVLRGTIASLLESELVVPPEDALLVNARHAAALREASAALQAARVKLLAGEPVELAASDLRGAVEAMGAITGKIDNERMLDKLFASFCIGK